MISNRQWMTLCLAGACLGGFALAQSGTGAGTSGGSGAGAASGFGSSASGAAPSGTGSSSTDSSGAGKSGTPAKPGTGFEAPATPGKAGDVKKPVDPTKAVEPTTPEAGGTPATPTRSVDPFIPTKPAKTPETDSTPGASSTFGSPNPQPNPQPDATPGGTAPATDNAPSGASSAFGPGEGGSATKTPPPSFTLPGFFGGPSTTYVAGQGRLARPRFRYRVTFSQGYDDNVLQSPDNPVETQVLVTPGTPATVNFVPVTTNRQVFLAGGNLVGTEQVTTLQPVVTPARDPVIRTVRGQERVGSLVSRLGLRMDAQQFSRRSVFTADLNAQIDHIYNRPGASGNQDYSGSLSMTYLYNLTPRLQATAFANVAYIAQPDFTRANTPERLGGGDVINALGRLNLMYRISPRLTATVGAGQNAIIFVDKGAAATAGGRSRNGDSFETTLSAEAKYLWKPRYSLLAEFRHVLIDYPDTPVLNSRTELLLLGAEMKLSSRLTASLRLGNAVRTFEDTGDSSVSPYGEATLAYRLGPTSQVVWSSRYGFDEPISADSEVLTYRTSLTYIKNFTPRLSLAAGLTGVFSTTSASANGQDNTQQTFDANISLEYHYTRQLTLNATFSYTKAISTSGDLDFDRSRVFLGAEYEF